MEDLRDEPVHCMDLEFAVKAAPKSNKKVVSILQQFLCKQVDNTFSPYHAIVQ